MTNYAVRYWVNDALADSFDTPNLAEALARFRRTLDIAHNAVTGHGRFYLAVTVEEGAYPTRSWTLASYQQPGVLHAAV